MRVSVREQDIVSKLPHSFRKPRVERTQDACECALGEDRRVIPTKGHVSCAIHKRWGGRLVDEVTGDHGVAVKRPIKVCKVQLDEKSGEGRA